MTKEEMQEEITRLRKQVEALTDALVDVAMSQGPTYVPYPVAPAPTPTPMTPYTPSPYSPQYPSYPIITCGTQTSPPGDYQVIN